MSTVDIKEHLEHVIAFKEPTIETVGTTINVQYANDEYTVNSPVPEKVLKQVENYQTDYLEHLADRATDIAISEFRKNKEAARVVASAPYYTYGTTQAEVIRKYDITDKDGNNTNDPTILMVVDQPNQLRDTLIDLKEKLKIEM